MTPVPPPGSAAGRPSGSRAVPNPSSDPGARPQRPETPTPSPDAVRTALRALATGAPPSPRPEYRETVTAAAAATASAPDAVTFLRAGRLPELARAVADAEAAARREGSTDGEAEATAERGRRALSTLRRLDAAIERAFGSGGGDTGENRNETAPDGEPAGRLRPREDGGDHFRSGHDIVLPRTDQSADR